MKARKLFDLPNDLLDSLPTPSHKTSNPRSFLQVSSAVLSLLATAGLVSATLGDTNKVLPQIPGMWRNAPGKNTTQSEDDTQTEQSTRAIGGITSLPRRWIESLQTREAEVITEVVTEAA